MTTSTGSSLLPARQRVPRERWRSRSTTATRIGRYSPSQQRQLLLAVRYLRIENSSRPLDRWIVGQLEPVDVVIHVWPERAQVMHRDALLCGQAHRVTILYDGAIGKNVAAKYAHEIVSL